MANTQHPSRSASPSPNPPGTFSWLNGTQFLGALNDNILKLLIVFFLIDLKGADQAGVIAAKAGAVFVLPFLLFSAASGILADRLSKQRIIFGVKALEVAAAALGVGAFAAGSEYGLYGVLFLMARQSALFGPSKYGIVPELVRKEELSKASRRLLQENVSLNFQAKVFYLQACTSETSAFRCRRLMPAALWGDSSSLS